MLPTYALRVVQLAGNITEESQFLLEESGGTCLFQALMRNDTKLLKNALYELHRNDSLEALEELCAQLSFAIKKGLVLHRRKS